MAPTESLNDPRVFLGVLRAMGEFEGRAPSDPAFVGRLAQIETDIRPFLGPDLHLARTGERNLLRNSQQYWKALSVLEKTQPGIELTDFGRKIAGGEISTDDFAASIVKTLELPNRQLASPTELANWASVPLVIKPLELVLETILELDACAGIDAAYLTRDELVSVIIPLSGVQASPNDIAETLVEFRTNPGTFTFPNCAPEANDPRMAMEFLLFLANYGFLHRDESMPNADQRFSLSDEGGDRIRALLSFTPPNQPIEDVATAVSQQNIVNNVERARKLASVLSRPQQAKFRRDVLTACGGCCLLTGESMPSVLRACHIIEVKDGGPDIAANGIALRSDLHDLFDSGHLRISTTGKILLSEAARVSVSYGSLPEQIDIPAHLDQEALRKRFVYQ